MDNWPRWGGDFLFTLAESMSAQLDESCKFIRLDAQGSCVALQVLPPTSVGAQNRFVGVSADKLDAATFIPILLRTATPLIVERALGLSDDSFMTRMNALLKKATNG